MSNSNLTESILHRVADKQLKPRPRWQFIIKQILIWLGVLLSIIFGSIASSILVFLIINNDWEVYDVVTHSLLQFIILTLPYFWLAVLALFISLAYFYMRKTKRGYRYSLWKLAFIYVVLCSLLGSVTYVYGGSQKIDRLLTINVPIYKTLVNQQTVRWTQPQTGLLAGDIETIDSNKKEFILEDIDGHQWHINYVDAKFDSKVKLIEDERVRLVGIKNDDNHFTAKQILVTKPTLHKKTKAKIIKK